MIKHLKGTVLAVLVITAWVMALIWLSLSVAQIAVERTITVSVQAHCLPAGAEVCRH